MVRLRVCAGGFGVAGVLMGLGWSSGVRGGTGYSVQELPFPGVGYGVPAAINDAGDVLLKSGIGPEIDAVIYRQGVSQLIVPPAGMEFYGSGIGGGGEVAGTLSTEGDDLDQTPVAVAATYADGVWTTLPAVSGYGTTDAFGMNDSGDVVGFGIDSEGWTHALLWSGGTVRVLETAGDMSSYGLGINHNGTAVEIGINGGVEVANLWRRNSEAISIGGLPGGLGLVKLINDRDQVLVPVVTGSKSPGLGFYYQWYLWDSGVVTEVPALAGMDDSQVTGFNDDGVIVANDGDEAFILRAGVLTDLNGLIPADSGWQLMWASGLNDGGQIVGLGEYEGALTPFLLTPVVPEPGVVGVGLVVLGLRRRGRA